MRYLPLDASEREAMLARIGVADIEALFADIPADKRIQGLLDMPLAKSEMAVERAMTTIASAASPPAPPRSFSAPAPTDTTSRRRSIISSSVPNS